MTLLELSKIIQAELRGDAILQITGVASLENARAGDLSYAADLGRLREATGCQASALIISTKVSADDPALSNYGLLIAKDAKLAFARAIHAFHETPYRGLGVSSDLSLGHDSRVGMDCSIYPRVTIGRNSSVGDRVTLHPGVVIGDDCRVGDDSTLYANVTLYDRTEIGARCRIHSGTVLGSDGFSFTPDEEGRQFKLLQVGRVIVEEDVEIGANCCVDRGGFGETRIRRGAKFDNLIQIGHNVEIGEDTVVAALAGFSGGTRVGRRCIIAGQIGTNQHITIGDGVIVTARTGVTKSVDAGRLIGGMMPAMDYQKWRKSQALYGRLPELFDRIRKIEKKLQS
jgi:UDP-3-O-[3-hydroxymyristoyl] glucosamine N-acyltransferase